MSTKERQETFNVGDNVTWIMNNTRISDINQINQKKHGDGPFEVIETIPVPTNLCACGNRLGDCYFSQNGFITDAIGICHQSMVEAVGHTQWVKISYKGQPLLDSRGEVQDFSGALFKKIEDY